MALHDPKIGDFAWVIVIGQRCGHLHDALLIVAQGFLGTNINTSPYFVGRFISDVGPEGAWGWGWSMLGSKDIGT